MCLHFVPCTYRWHPFSPSPQFWLLLQRGSGVVTAAEQLKTVQPGRSPCPPAQPQVTWRWAEQEVGKADSSVSSVQTARCQACSFIPTITTKGEHKHHCFFISFIKELRKKNTFTNYIPAPLPGCQGGEILRILLAQSGHSLSIRKSGSGLCCPSVKKVMKQLPINDFEEVCKGQIVCTQDSYTAGQSLCSIKPHCSSEISATVWDCNSWGSGLHHFLFKPL